MTEHPQKTTSLVAQFWWLGSRQLLAKIEMRTMTIGELWIESSTSAKILGVTFDNELGMDLHVNCQQHYSKLLLSLETAEIHKTIIHHGFRENIDLLPHIVPCWLLQLYFYGATNSVMRRLQSVLSAAVRLISHKSLTHHSCAEGSTTLASHLPAYQFQDHSLRPQRPPWSRSTYLNISQLHLYSCLRGQPQSSPAICCMRWPNCASNQDPSLRVKKLPCLWSGCVELVAWRHFEIRKCRWIVSNLCSKHIC